MLALPKSGDIKIINIESIIDTSHEFDIELVGAILSHLEVKMYRNSLSVRMASYPHLVLNITENGLIILSGTKTMDEAKSLFGRVLTYVKSNFLPNLDADETAMKFNISGTLEVGFKIALKELHEYSVLKTQYHPAGLFVNIRIEQPKMKFVAYASGKIYFDGCQQMSDIPLGLMVVTPILFTFRDINA